MIRFGFIAFFLALCAAQANARTIQYDFNIVSSTLSLGSLYESDTLFTGPERPIAASDPLYDSVVAAIHPLAHLMGQTGRVSVQMSGDPWGTTSGFLNSVNCFSGILCADFNRINGSIGHPSTFDATGFDIYAWGAQPSGEWFLRLLDSIAGTGEISFTDDQSSGFGFFNGKTYRHGGAWAQFAVTDLSITEVSAAPNPVPLPATVWLLGLGVFALGIKARRRAI